MGRDKRCVPCPREPRTDVTATICRPTEARMAGYSFTNMRSNSAMSSGSSSNAQDTDFSFARHLCLPGSSRRRGVLSSSGHVRRCKCFDLRAGECETCSIPVAQRRELVFDTAQFRGDVTGVGAAGLSARFVQFRPRWGVVARRDLVGAPALMQRARWLRTIRPG